MALEMTIYNRQTQTSKSGKQYIGYAVPFAPGQRGAIPAELRRNVQASFKRMLAFYGFELIEESPLRVVPSESFFEQSSTWLMSSNHNHLRITRI